MNSDIQNENFNSLEMEQNTQTLISNVDDLVDELIESEQTPLRERIGDNKVALTNYLKHDGGSGSAITGYALLLNKISNLAVIDFDINKKYDDEQKKIVRNKITSSISDNDVIVKTGSGGIHV